MTKQFLKDAFLWGVALWFIGYILGIVFFMFLPKALIGWVIMPVGILITLWVLFKKIKSKSWRYYLKIAVIWTLIAIIFDYLFLVRLFKLNDYYKLDVYIYYLLTFALPLLAAWRKGFIKSK